MELLISSNICRYAEFRAVDKVLTLLNGAVKAVPSSRSDVFTSKDVSVVEKRLLMKVLASCMASTEDDDEFAEFKSKTFKEYLLSKRLTPNLIHYIVYAISMSDDSTSCLDGVRSTKEFLQSLGRYGNTPFLFPMYGCGEISQCFCRLCAVFGGVYCLSRAIDSIKCDDDTKLFSSIECGGQTVNARALVIGNGGKIGSSIENIPQHNRTELEDDAATGRCGGIARAVFITSKPLGNEALNSGGGGVNLLRLPAIDGSTDGAIVIQLSHFSGTCPKDLCKSSFQVFLKRIKLHFGFRFGSYFNSSNWQSAEGRYRAILPAAVQ